MVRAVSQSLKELEFGLLYYFLRVRHSGYCLMRKYQLKYCRWILLTVDSSAETNDYSFRFFEGAWQYDVAKEQELAQYRRAKLNKYSELHGRPGRNDPCRCNSTLKYKKCCGSVA